MTMLFAFFSPAIMPIETTTNIKLRRFFHT